MKPKVVIIGGGFGGVYTARELARYADRDDIELTLISRSNYFLFTPLLHEVATGALGPTSVAEPLREMFRRDKVRIVQAGVDSVDLEKKVVHVNGTGSCSVPYDYLVYAGGATTNFYGIDGAEEHSLTLKNLEDAMDIRARVIDSFEAALVAKAHRTKHKGEPDYAKEELSFVIVGGGPTGVELATELAEFIHETLCAYYGEGKAGIDWSQVSITLLAASPELLTQCHPTMRTTALRELEKRGVKVVCGAQVTRVTERAVFLATGASIPTAHVFWVAGVRASLPVLEFPEGKATGKHVILDRSGRLVVDKYMHITASPIAGSKEVLPVSSVFTLGDAGGTTPMLAQVATRAARVVSKNIMQSIANSQRSAKGRSARPLSEFTYHSAGSLVSLGRWSATGDIYGFHISGPIAWLIWRGTYITKFITWRKRFKVLTDWAINVFYPRDVTKVR